MTELSIVTHEIKEVKRLEGFGTDKYFQDDFVNSCDVILNKYEKLKENETQFEYSFSCAGPRGNLFSEENGVSICAHISKKVAEESKNIPYMVYTQETFTIDRKYQVKVYSVDRENKKVELSIETVNNEERTKLINALEEGIKNKEVIRVPATIIGFSGEDRETGVRTNTIALVNIANLNIIGAIRITEWSSAYTKNYRHIAHVGQVVEVAVYKTLHWRKSGQVFDCSRRMILETDGFNPWKDIEKRFPKKTDVRVKCISLEDRKFFAIIDGVPELNVFCEYPDEGSNIVIEEGKDYIGYVYKVSEERKLLRVRIREAIIE